LRQENEIFNCYGNLYYAFKGKLNESVVPMPSLLFSARVSAMRCKNTSRDKNTSNPVP
jgi:hypothetical protein